MKRPPTRPGPPPVKKRPAAPRVTHRTVLPASRVLDRVRPPKPQKRPKTDRPAPNIGRPQARRIGRFLDEDSTLLDIIDNLLNKGVVLNAEVVLALANVDLVYIQLSALLCAADRVLPRSDR